MKKQIIFAISVFIILLVIVVFSIALRVKEFKITLIPKQYTYVYTYEETQEMEVFIYVNEKKSFFTNINELKRCYISDESKTEEILIKVLSINDKKRTEEIKNEKFYLYSFVFRIPLITTNEVSIKIIKAYLHLGFSNININLNIGSFYLRKIPYYGDKLNAISFMSLKGLVDVIKVNKTLSALYLSLRNNLDQSIKITSLELLEANCHFSLSEIKITEDSVSQTDKLNWLLGYQYQFLGESSDFKLSYQIEADSIINLIVPIKYTNTIEVSSCGFIIEYFALNETHYFYFDDFIFFNDSMFIVDVNSLLIYTYENT